MSPNAAVTRPATSLPGAHPREALLLAHLPQVERIDLGVEAGVLAMDAYLFTPRVN